MQHARIAGFDGVRGIAVALVVAFHLWPDVVPGGFLGVTLFFALSGYLITSLLLDEVDRSGSVSLRGFYQRRVRRILPAALATVSVVAVVWFIAGWATSTTRRELVAALLQVTNWQQIVDGGVYGASTDRSPVLHFWSLAIEEQVYLVLPLVVLLARRRWVIGFTLGVLVSATALGTWLVAGDTSLVYFSTFTRSGEMLVGAVLATALHRRSVPTGRNSRMLIAGLGIASLGGLVALGLTTSLGTEGYYRGGLLACGVLAAVGVAAVAHQSDLGARLDVAPLRWVGERSYGIYLVHWPLLLGFTAAGMNALVLPV
ncbi:MAG: acyltransferase family protein, partial [Ilumatobacteraceae bacterium]